MGHEARLGTYDSLLITTWLARNNLDKINATTLPSITALFHLALLRQPDANLTAEDIEAYLSGLVKPLPVTESVYARHSYDHATQQVTFPDGSTASFSPRPSRALGILFQYPAQLIRSSEIMRRVWSDNLLQQDAGKLRVNMSRARRALQGGGDFGDNTLLIVGRNEDSYILTSRGDAPDWVRSRKSFTVS